MDFEKLDEILDADESIQYVGVIDSKGNIIDSRIKPNTINESEQEMMRVDLFLIKQMLDIYNSSFGKTISFQTTREKVNQLIFYHDYMIIYVACDPRIDKLRMFEIAEKTEQLVKDLVGKKQFVQSY